MFWKTATAIAALSVLTPCGALAQESTVNYNTDAVSDVTTSNTSVNQNTNVNTNNNINSGDQTIRGINQNTNVNTNSSTNVNTNNVINSGDQTIRNIGTNSSSSTSANTNSNTNVNQSTSTSANTNVNTSTTNSAVTSTSSTNNVNTDNSTSVSTATQNVTSDTTTENTNTNNNTSNSTQDVTQRIVSPPPTAMAPTIMSSYSQDVCMTSASGALQTQFFGLSGGKGVRDMNCERMKLGKTLFDMGMRVAAVSLLCQDTRVYESMAMAGTPCPYNGLIGEEAAAGWEANPEAAPNYEASRRPLVRRAGRPR
jgi:hypothetical protein